MALVRICDEDRTLTDEAEITAHLAACGIDYEHWQPGHPVPEDAPPEVILQRLRERNRRVEKLGAATSLPM